MPPVPKPRKPARKGPNRNLVIALAAAAVVAAALIAGSILLTGGDDKAVATTTAPTGSPAAPVTLVAGIPQQGTVLGSPDANVRLLTFEDLQCPFCRDFTVDALPAIVKEYVRPGRIRIDFRGMAFLGPDSEKALRITLAAGQQNKLWEVLGLLYERQGLENSGWVTDELVDEVLGQVPGLDVAKAKADAGSAAVTKKLAEVQAEADANDIRGTPSFLVAAGIDKPYRLQVELTPEAFRPALDDALKG